MNRLESIGFKKSNDSYSGLGKQPFDITGILLYRDNNTMKIEVPNHYTIEVKVKNPLQVNVGEKITVDKSQILSYKILERKNEEDKVQTNRYTELLKGYGIEITEESLEAVKLLEAYNIPVTKENIRALMTSKTLFHTIREELNYETAIQLMEKGIDVEKASLQEISDAIREIQQDKDTSFSFMKIFQKKKILSDQDAEKIAKELYGNAMGKDIHDIIKALHQAGSSVTKKNVDQIYEAFYKLDKLKNIDAKTIVDIHQKNIEPTIRNMHYVQYDMKESSVSSIEGLSSWGAAKYEGHTAGMNENHQMSKEEIQSHLQNIGIEPSEENIQAAEKLLRAGEPVSQENMEKIISIRKGLNQVSQKMDYQKAAEMLQDGIDIERTDIRQLAEHVLKDLMNGTYEDKKTDGIYQELSVELEKALDGLSKHGEIKQEDLMKLLKDKMDIPLNKIEKVLDIYPLQNTNDMDRINSVDTSSSSEKFLVRGFNKILDISQLFSSVKSLSFQNITAHLTKGLPLSLNSIKQQVNEMTIGVANQAAESVRVQEDQTRVFINENKMTLQSVLLTQGWQRTVDIGKTLLTNGMQLNIPNIRQVNEAYSQYSKVRETLTSSMVLDSIDEGIDIESLELAELYDYVTGKAVNKGQNAILDYPVFMKRQYGMADTMAKSISEENENPLKSKMSQLVKDIQHTGEEEKKIFPLLLKNEMEFSLKEIQQLSSFLKNQHQLGQQINEILQQTGVIQHPVLKEKLQKLEQMAKRVSDKLKSGDPDVADAYKSLTTLIKDMHHDGSFAQEEGSQDLQQQMSDMLDYLEMQKKLNRKNMAFQFPVLVNGELTNLQMYMLQDYRIKNKTNPGTLDMMVNLHTKHIGQIQGAIHFDGKRVTIEMTVEQKSGKEKLQEYLPYLHDELKAAGYELAKIDFMIGEPGAPRNALSNGTSMDDSGSINYEI